MASDSNRNPLAESDVAILSASSLASEMHKSGMIGVSASRPPKERWTTCKPTRDVVFAFDASFPYKPLDVAKPQKVVKLDDLGTAKTDGDYEVPIRTPFVVSAHLSPTP
ncbi:hypothetical protein AX16_010229 [Volvariella volvacea WC 439]|nr:hypothetical protein AX16_010229 [Volvariella volvacea WC 439]